MKKIISLVIPFSLLPYTRICVGGRRFQLSVSVFYLWFIICGGLRCASKKTKINGWEDQFHVFSPGIKYTSKVMMSPRKPKSFKLLTYNDVQQGHDQWYFSVHVYTLCALPRIQVLISHNAWYWCILSLYFDTFPLCLLIGKIKNRRNAV